jgi:hypothetical protein
MVRQFPNPIPEYFSPSLKLMTNLTFYIQPGGFLRGRLRVPGDKSISHRAPFT